MYFSSSVMLNWTESTMIYCQYILVLDNKLQSKVTIINMTRSFKNEDFRWILYSGIGRLNLVNHERQRNNRLFITSQYHSDMHFEKAFFQWIFLWMFSSCVSEWNDIASGHGRWAILIKILHLQCRIWWHPYQNHIISNPVGLTQTQLSSRRREGP